MMQALECYGWRKSMSPDEATWNSEEIKAVAIAVIESRLSKGISQSVGRSVDRSVSQSAENLPK